MKKLVITIAGLIALWFFVHHQTARLNDIAQDQVRAAKTEALRANSAASAAHRKDEELRLHNEIQQTLLKAAAAREAASNTR